MRGDALKPILLTLVYLTLTQAEKLQFPPALASCIGGGADDEYLHPGMITCTRTSQKWECISTSLHDSLFRIHHTRVNCVDQECTLEYKLDFTPLAIFVIGSLATVLAGLFLAVAMYLAVLKMAGRYGLDAESEREKCLGLRRPGYGSFGGKLYRLGQFSDSLKSLLEFDVEEGLEGDVEMGQREEEAKVENEENEEKERVEWVEREMYLG